MVRVNCAKLMFPSRFASGREPQPGWKFGAGVNDIVFLSSRDGLKFDRTFMEAFIRPGLDQGNWHERSLYMERGILQTSPTELSLYCMQNMTYIQTKYTNHKCDELENEYN